MAPRLSDSRIILGKPQVAISRTLSDREALANNPTSPLRPLSPKCSKLQTPQYLFFPASLLPTSPPAPHPKPPLSPGGISLTSSDPGHDYSPTSRFQTQEDWRNAQLQLQAAAGQRPYLQGKASQRPGLEARGAVRQRGQRPLVELNPAVAGFRTWSSLSDDTPEAEEESPGVNLLRSSTSPAWGNVAESPSSPESTEEGPSPQDDCERKAVCINYSNVVDCCQERELERDTIEGVSIVPLPSHIPSTDQSEHILYALYFSSFPERPVLSGEDSTVLLFPKALQDKAKDVQESSLWAKSVRDTCGLRGGKQDGGPALSDALGSVPGPLATFAEWKVLRQVN